MDFIYILSFLLTHLFLFTPENFKTHSEKIWLRSITETFFFQYDRQHYGINHDSKKSLTATKLATTALTQLGAMIA